MDATTTTTTIDLEAQFYPFISTAINGDEHQIIVLHLVFLSFHEDSSYPPQLSNYWNLSWYP